ncbi:iron ABC transporter permease [Paracoccaceae bacterium]|nr:iron ABC transporter permease [Paracoccaceae bacterium]
MATEQDNQFNEADPSYQITFPKDHGPHKNFRIEWWYFTANLRSDTLDNLGIQWTLFKSNLKPLSKKKDPEHINGFWMAHSALTTETSHYYEERFAREKTGQAGVTLEPFKAWIDNWSMKGDNKLGTIQLESMGVDFSFSLNLSTKMSPVLQGDRGFSKKSKQRAASHYYSQPFYSVKGWVILNGKQHFVKGVGWLDREWSSNLLNENQLGWDWFSLHLDNGEKVMLFKVRNKNGEDFLSGSWVSKDGAKKSLSSSDFQLEETAYSTIKGKRVPTKWKISILGSYPLTINTEALNINSWMATSFPYWEGPILFSGDLTGVGYLEMTGY